MWIFFIFALFSPLFIRFGTHFENEFASLEDFRIRDTAALMQLAVEACGRRIEEPSAVYGSEVRIDIVCRIEFFETAARLQDKHTIRMTEVRNRDMCFLIVWFCGLYV